MQRRDPFDWRGNGGARSRACRSGRRSRSRRRRGCTGRSRRPPSGSGIFSSAQRFSRSRSAGRAWASISAFHSASLRVPRLKPHWNWNSSRSFRNGRIALRAMPSTTRVPKNGASGTACSRRCVPASRPLSSTGTGRSRIEKTRGASDGATVASSARLAAATAAATEAEAAPPRRRHLLVARLRARPPHPGRTRAEIESPRGVARVPAAPCRSRAGRARRSGVSAAPPRITGRVMPSRFISSRFSFITTVDLTSSPDIPMA
jgi:hypothetical protein